MYKSGFSLSRNASQNSRASMFDTLVERPPNNPSEQLRRQLKTLKERNQGLAGEIAKLRQHIVEARSTNLHYLSEMLVAIEPTGKQQIHSNILMTDEESSVYARYLVDSYTDINDQAKQFENYFKRMALKAKLYDQQIADTYATLAIETLEKDKEIATLKKDLSDVVADKEEKLKCNDNLNKNIEELRRGLDKVQKQTEVENEKIDQVKTQICEAEAKLEKVKSARQKLQELDTLLNKTLSKDALIQNQQKTMSMQDQLFKLKQMNAKAQIQLLKLRESRQKKDRHFKTHI